MNTQQARPRPIRLMRPAQGARTLNAASRKQAKAARYRMNSSASGTARPLPGAVIRTSSTTPARNGDQPPQNDGACPGGCSEGVGGPVGAELVPEGVADLADGGQAAEGLAHGDQEVV